MSIPGRRIVHLVVTGAAALAFLMAPTTFLAQTTGQQVARPCYDGVIPGNPYIPNCAFPPRQGGVRGSAPDAQAIIACRNWPGCLSWYINNPH